MIPGWFQFIPDCEPYKRYIFLNQHHWTWNVSGADHFGVNCNEKLTPQLSSGTRANELSPRLADWGENSTPVSPLWLQTMYEVECQHAMSINQFMLPVLLASVQVQSQPRSGRRVNQSDLNGKYDGIRWKSHCIYFPNLPTWVVPAAEPQNLSQSRNPCCWTQVKPRLDDATFVEQHWCSWTSMDK